MPAARVPTAPRIAVETPPAQPIRRAPSDEPVAVPDKPKESAQPVPTMPTSLTTAPAPTSGPEPALPTTPTPVPLPTHAAQLAMRLVPLRTAPDGVHRLTVHLNPGDLGPISVTAEVRDGAIAVHLTGATEAGREALDAALPDLRRHLAEGGYGSCSLEMRPHSTEQTMPGLGTAAPHQASQPNQSHTNQSQPTPGNQASQYDQAGFQRHHGQHGQHHRPGTHDAPSSAPGDTAARPAAEPRLVDAPHRALDLRV
jgi:flagellar hook-length control protein FliK